MPMVSPRCGVMMARDGIGLDVARRVNARMPIMALHMPLVERSVVEIGGTPVPLHEKSAMSVHVSVMAPVGIVAPNVRRPRVAVVARSVPALARMVLRYGGRREAQNSEPQRQSHGRHAPHCPLLALRHLFWSPTTRMHGCSPRRAAARRRIPDQRIRWAPGLAEIPGFGPATSRPTRLILQITPVPSKALGLETGPGRTATEPTSAT